MLLVTQIHLAPHFICSSETELCRNPNSYLPIFLHMGGERKWHCEAFFLSNMVSPYQLSFHRYSIFNHLSVDTLTSQFKVTETHFSTTLNIVPINGTIPLNFSCRVWFWFCNFADSQQPGVNPPSWQWCVSVFTFAIGDRIEHFGDLTWVVDPGVHGVGRLEAVQSHSRLLLVHQELVLHCPSRFHLNHTELLYSKVQHYVVENNRLQCSGVQ
jgi:hypothetical protein